MITYVALPYQAHLTRSSLLGGLLRAAALAAAVTAALPAVTTAGADCIS